MWDSILQEVEEQVGRLDLLQLEDKEGLLAIT